MFVVHAYTVSDPLPQGFWINKLNRPMTGVHQSTGGTYGKQNKTESSIRFNKSSSFDATFWAYFFISLFVGNVIYIF